jgi:hypothetical protein
LRGEAVREAARRALKKQLRPLHFGVTAQDDNDGVRLRFDCDSDEKSIVK